ncbi:unnamed protein product, partial [Mesorhabditis spiculigera]
MIELGFFPARPQQRGTLYVLQTAHLFNNSTDPDPINIYIFLQRLERRIVTIYNGTMDVVDARTDDAKMLKALIKKEDISYPGSELRVHFQISVMNKVFFGGLLCAEREPKVIHLVFVDQ